MTVTAPDLFQICDEFQVPRNTPFPSGFYGKPGFPTSGPFSLQQCVGLSNVTFTPDGGSTGGIGVGSANCTLLCNLPAVWTYSLASGTGGSVDIASGTAAGSITFTVTAPGAGTRTCVWNVNGSAAGVSRDFTVTVDAQGTG
jgi:hypothetical protein